MCTATSIKAFLKSLSPGAFKAPGLLIGLWIALGTSHAYGDVMVIVTQADNGREIRVPSGGRLQIDLPQAGAAGYVWEVEDLDPELFEVLEAGTTGRPGPQEIVGASVSVRWDLRAKKAGRAQVRLLHCRPWEGRASALEGFLLNVQID